MFITYFLDLKFIHVVHFSVNSFFSTDNLVYVHKRQLRAFWKQLNISICFSGSAPRSELQKKKKSKVSVQEDEDLERGRQKLLDKFYSSNKKSKKPTSEPPKKKKSKVSVQEDEENLERCRQKLLDKLKSPSKLKKNKKVKRCDTKKSKKRHSMPN